MKNRTSAALWKLRSVARVAALRRLLLKLLNLYLRPDRVHVIRRGSLRNRKWFYAADTSVWQPLGSYEVETVEWLLAKLFPGAVFFDIGANVGYMTLLGSLTVGDKGKVVSFEPVPENVTIIQKQIELNQLKNVSLETCALSDFPGETLFTVEKNSANSHFRDLPLEHARTDELRTITVPVATLDSYTDRHGIRPDVIKIDVEGAEFRTLKGAAKTLQMMKPAVLVSTHSLELKTTCRSLLESFDYTVTNLAGYEHEIVAIPGR